MRARLFVDEGAASIDVIDHSGKVGTTPEPNQIRTGADGRCHGSVETVVLQGAPAKLVADAGLAGDLLDLRLRELGGLFFRWENPANSKMESRWASCRSNTRLRVGSRGAARAGCRPPRSHRAPA